MQLYILEKAPELDVLDLENPPPGPGAQLPCVASLEFYADILEKRGEKENIEKATAVSVSLLPKLQFTQMDWRFQHVDLEVARERA